jgi:hypothetical protein
MNLLKKRILLFPLWFHLILFVFLINRYYLRPTGNIFLDGWLNDLLCLPILLELVQLSMRFIVAKNYVLSKFQLIVSIVYCSLLFEYFLPIQSAAFYSDPIDVICYTIGGLLWNFILNKDQIKNSKNGFRKSHSRSLIF